MANVTIEGHGSFSVNAEKVQELMQWLTTNGAVSVEGTQPKFEGQTLLNETGPRKDAGVSDAKPLPGKTYDTGGTWL